ncbi:neutral zinc metallopeptidase [Nonomuraea jiangxiensis]|uniref:Putative neutral zinc metallopeptidase n=1 Tax=Nonomuraea jiangxiensis TaxID=633440 RepID=A0A1G8P599_9ACTN|nr:neutral zinc metallopeptidase [Nonomuraea jiangxiensis]SDI87637.1 Putative neutral zinc metallopeptidase [Nonomuraea jiangxiensis]
MSRFVKSFTIAALAGALIVPLSGTAAAQTAAYPVKHPKLIDNPLYKAGLLPKTTCKEPRVQRNNRTQARAYINAVAACLGKTWKQHLTKAGLPYKPAKVQHMDRIPKKYCGFDVTVDSSQAYYCAKTSTLVFQIGKDLMDDPSDLWLFHLVSSHYGMHVQNMVGIEDAFQAIPTSSKSELSEQFRRHNLQSDCFAAAFLKSVSPMRGRSGKDWNHLLTLVKGDAARASSEKRVMGKPANVRAWIKRGYAGGNPAACNSWSAASSQVA